MFIGKFLLNVFQASINMDLHDQYPLLCFPSVWKENVIQLLKGYFHCDKLKILYYEPAFSVFLVQRVLVCWRRGTARQHVTKKESWLALGNNMWTSVCALHTQWHSLQHSEDWTLYSTSLAYPVTLFAQCRLDIKYIAQYTACKPITQWLYSHCGDWTLHSVRLAYAICQWWL